MIRVSTSIRTTRNILDIHMDILNKNMYFTYNLSFKGIYFQDNATMAGNSQCPFNPYKLYTMFLLFCFLFLLRSFFLSIFFSFLLCFFFHLLLFFFLVRFRFLCRFFFFFLSFLWCGLFCLFLLFRRLEYIKFTSTLVYLTC